MAFYKQIAILRGFPKDAKSAAAQTLSERAQSGKRHPAKPKVDRQQDLTHHEHIDHND